MTQRVSTMNKRTEKSQNLCESDEEQYPSIFNSFARSMGLILNEARERDRL